MSIRYFVVGYQRSGTTLIHLLLKDHPNVSALNDELQVSPFFSKGISCFTHGNDYREEKELGYARMYDTLTTLMADNQTLANGAKCVCNSKNSAQTLVDVISKYFKDMKIIHVVRNDLVAQYGSMIKSSRSGIMHSWYKGSLNQKPDSININKLLFIRYILGCLDTNSAISRLQKTNPYYQSIYEEFSKNPDKIKSELFNFIGIPDLKPDWLFSKKILPAPESYINKYQELYALMEKIKIQYENKTLPMTTIFLAKVFSKLYKQFNIAGTIRAKKRQRKKEARKLKR